MNADPPGDRTLEHQLRRACAELEQRVRAGGDRAVEEALAASPDLAGNTEAVLELIYAEYVLRGARPGRPGAEEWYRRFPQYRDRLERLFALHEAAGGSAGDTVERFLDRPAGPDAPGQAEKRPLTAGQLELLEEIGRGGMGVVYRARQAGLDRTVAVKVLLAGGHAGLHDLARFRREALAVARLVHPNIVQIYEVSERDGQPCFLMEYVAGGGLDRRLADGPLTPGQAARLVEVLARAVQVAHESGIVHRDLKPANVLLAGDPEAPIDDRVAKLVDFGLAKWLHETTGLGDRATSESANTLPWRTRTGAVLGTPSYMAPEQAEASAEVGPAADVYALGAILYECLTGRPPFQGATVLDTLEQVRFQEPVPPRQLQPKVPHDLETICLKCLQKEVGGRYPSARALAEDLGRFLSGRPVQARPVRALKRFGRWCRRNPTVAGLSLGLLSALVVGVTTVTLAWGVAERQRRLAVNEVAAKELALDQKNEALADAEDHLHAYAVTLAHREWQANNLERAEQLLLSCPPRLRHWEWNYLLRLCRPPVVTASEGLAATIQFSPDGQQGAAFQPENPGVVLWDARTGRVIRKLGQLALGRQFCFSPKGDLLAAGATAGGFLSLPDGGIKVWNTSTGQELLPLRSPASCQALNFSPDGQRLTSFHTDGTVQVRDVSKGAVLRSFLVPAVQPYDDRVTAFTSDGSSLVFARRDRTICIVSLDQGATVQVPSGHTDGLLNLAVSGDARKFVTAGRDGQIKVWQRQDNRWLCVSTWQAPGCRRVRFTADDRRVLALSDARVLKLWDIGTARVLFDLHAPMGEATDLALHPDGRRLAVTDLRGKMYLLEIATWEAVAAGPRLPNSRSFSLSPDGGLVARESRGAVLVHEVPGGNQRLRFPSPFPEVARTRISPDNRLLACLGTEGSVALHDLGGGLLQATLAGLGPAAPPGRLDWRHSCLAFSPDSQRLAVRYPTGTVKMWDAASRRELWSIPAGRSGMENLEFGPDGRTLTGGDISGVRVLDARDGKELYRLPKTDSYISAKAITPAGDLIAVGDRRGVIRLYHYPTGSEAGLLQGPPGSVGSLHFSRDGRRLVSTNARAVTIWDVRHRRELISLEEKALQARFSGDDSLLLTFDSAQQVRVRTGSRLPLDSP